MEHSENKEAMPPLCKAGCGFFGAPSQENYCSSCYKKQIQKQQQTSASSSTPATPPPTQTSSRTSTPPPPPHTPPSLADGVATSLAASAPAPPSPSTSTARPTVPSIKQSEGSAEGQALEDDSSSSDKEGSGKKKKNKCGSCKKKVGLTGFTCRCGGLYCAVHRYSDKHDCVFDYRSLGAREIRANNPLIKGEKVQKI